MQAHPIRRQAIRRRGLAEARSAEAVAPERGVRGTYKLSPERRAKGGLGCPVSHPEHGDTLIAQRYNHGVLFTHPLDLFIKAISSLEDMILN